MDMVARFSVKKEDRAHCDQFAKKFFVVSQEHEQGVKDIVVELYEIFHEAVEVSKKFEETIFF
jgi:formiminotetrahydrofolate cyclodeaminase